MKAIFQMAVEAGRFVENVKTRCMMYSLGGVGCIAFGEEAAPVINRTIEKLSPNMAVISDLFYVCAITNALEAGGYIVGAAAMIAGSSATFWSEGRRRVQSYRAAMR